MKRAREEDGEESKLKQDYAIYLQSNRADKEGLLGLGNPNRFKNALFELSFYLNINHVTREMAWKYLDNLQYSNFNIDVSFLFF